MTGMSADGGWCLMREYRARLRERQNEQLPRMMRLCAVAHPHYRRVLRERGLTADDFRTVEDLRRLPILHKREYVRDPERFRLRPEGDRRAGAGGNDAGGGDLHVGVVRQADAVLRYGA